MSALRGHPSAVQDFFYRIEGVAGATIQNEDQPHLGGDGDGGCAAAEGEEKRLGRDVVVPEIMMNSLKRPDFFAGGGVEGDDGICVAVVARAHASVVVGCGAAGGEIDEVECGIDGDGAPCVGCAGWDGLARAQGIGSQVQSGLPVRASKARTMPEPESTN